jgi:hypothetical protein
MRGLNFGTVAVAHMHLLNWPLPGIPELSGVSNVILGAKLSPLQWDKGCTVIYSSISTREETFTHVEEKIIRNNKLKGKRYTTVRIWGNRREHLSSLSMRGHKSQPTMKGRLIPMLTHQPISIFNNLELQKETAKPLALKEPRSSVHEIYWCYAKYFRSKYSGITLGYRTVQ